MFARRLHPSPLGLALGLVLLALWAAVWIGVFASAANEARARRPRASPDRAHIALLQRATA
jgi:hypothetical protein